MPAENDPRGAPSESSALPSVDLEALEDAINDAMFYNPSGHYDLARAALERARLAAPTGQREAGADDAAAIAQYNRAREENARWSAAYFDARKLLEAVLENFAGPPRAGIGQSVTLGRIKQYLAGPVPAAAPPSAPQDGLPFDEALNMWAQREVDQIVDYKFTGDLSDQPWGLFVDALLEARRQGRREGARNPALASGQPPARPPSPAVDAAPIDREAAFRRKAQERAARAHNPKPVKTDTRPRCTAITRRGHACLAPGLFGGLCTSHAASRWHRYVKQQAAPKPDAAPIEGRERCGNCGELYTSPFGCPACSGEDEAAAPPAPPIPPAVTEKEVVPSATGAKPVPEMGGYARRETGEAATPGVVLKEGTAPALRAGMLRLLKEGVGPGSGYYEPDERLPAAVSLLEAGWGAVARPPEPALLPEKRSQSQSPAVSETRELTEEKK